MEKLKRYDLNCNIFDVYDYDGLSMQELLCQFFTKINECVDFSNSTLDLCEWLVNEGLKQEVAIKLTNWLNDGTLENIINVTLFENLNKKINDVSSQLEHIEKSNNIYFDKYNPCKDNIFDNSEKLTQAIKDCLATGKDLLISPGTYKFSKTINVGFSSQDFKIKGIATKCEGFSNIKFYFDGDGVFLKFTGARNIYFENIEISGYLRNVDTNCYKKGTTGLSIEGSIIAENCNLNGFEIISQWNGGYYHKYINCNIQFSSVCFNNYNANNLIFDKCKCHEFEKFLIISGGDGTTVIRDSSFEKFTKTLFSSSSGSSSSLLIEGCYIENYPEQTPKNGLNGEYKNVTSITGFKNITLIGNAIFTKGIKDFIYTNEITHTVISLGNRIVISENGIGDLRNYIYNSNLKNVILNDICLKVGKQDGEYESKYINGFTSTIKRDIYNCFTDTHVGIPGEKKKYNKYLDVFTINPNSTTDINIDLDFTVNIFDDVSVVLFGSSTLPNGVIYQILKVDNNQIVLRFLNTTSSIVNINTNTLRVAITVTPFN